MAMRNGAWWLSAVALLLVTDAAKAQLVPGTGQKVTSVGDNFEDPRWGFNKNGHKSSQENDGRVRSPRGRARNGRWVEGTKRGYPDRLERVATPPGGLPGSKAALLIQTLHSGIPGKITRKMQQDDLMTRTHEVSVASSPSYVVRVYLPPFEEWEDRTGSTFGFRVGARTNVQDQIVTRKYGKRTRRSFEPVELDATEPYWPGMFIQFLSSHEEDRDQDAAILVCRAARTGLEFPGLNLKPGWWTFGLSFTPDGAIHYYASPGVDNLTPNDRIGSSFPYNYHAETATTMFFNICSPDDGKTWSTAWIIDDPAMYVANPSLTGFRTEHEGITKRRGGFLGGLFR